MKKQNKGFSLVELIIVIAIMAILAAAIAPALIRYIDKSRRADDLSAAETINSAMSSALANEDAYDEIQSHMNGTVIASALTGQPFSAQSGINCPTFLEELNSNIGGSAPKLKYRKDSQSGWAVGVSTVGKPIVWIATNNNANLTAFSVQPEIDKKYK
jgi:type IV pilus assembly protein PilA